jgi:hypothetical protein
MRRSLAQYHDCLEGQQVQYNPHMPTNSGIYFSATIASSRERASSRIPSTRPSRRVTPDLPRRGTTQVDTPAVTERLHKIGLDVGDAMRAVTGNRHLEHQRVRSSRGIVRKQCNGRDSSDARTNCLPSSRPAVAFFCGDQERGIKDIRLAPHFWASPAFLLEKRLSVAIPIQLAWKLALIPDIPNL